MKKEKDVSNWEKLHKNYLKAVIKAINYSSKNNNYLPPGLYDYKTGEAAAKGLKEFRSSQDWENNLMIYPTEILSPDNPIIMGTLETIRRNKYREGVMTYRNGMHVHQYVTYNQAQQYLSVGEQKRALVDFYHILLHNGSVHEGFENLVEPWEDRDPHPSPPPHAWAAAKTVVFIRNMLIREFGGEAGIKEEKRSLYLFSLLSPEWVKENKKISIKNAVTEMGIISAEMHIKKDGASVNIKKDFHQQPQYITITIPYFKNLITYESDANKSFYKNGIIYFSPNVTEISLKWEDKSMDQEYNYQDILKAYREEPNYRWDGYEQIGNPKSLYVMNEVEQNEMITIPGQTGFLLEDEVNYPPTHLSFELIIKTFKKEYRRRYKQYIESGKRPIKIEPVYMLSTQERLKHYFDQNQ